MISLMRAGSPAPKQFFVGLIATLGLSLGASAAGAGEPTRLAAVEPNSAVYQTPAPMQFFTINQVLAKHDRMRAMENNPAAAIQLASLQPSPTMDVGPTREPFGLLTFRAPDGALWVKWRKVQTEMQSDMNVVSDCKRDQAQCPSDAAKRLSALVREAAALHGRAKINLVHRSINRAVRYVSDLQQHGVIDVWSSPLATLAAAQGDCEDYAIAKYATLLMAGVKPEDLRILLVRDRRVGQDHAVLGVKNQGEWLILDNRWSEAVTVADVPQFTPLFAIDREGVKLVAVAYADNSPTPARSEERAAQRFEDTDDLLPAAADDNFLW